MLVNKSTVRFLRSLENCDVYLYGGFLRDLIIKQTPSDVDIKVYISEDKIGVVKKIIRFFIHLGHEVDYFMISRSSILIRVPEIALDLMIYFSYNKYNVRTNFVINSFHINLKNGKYFFDDKYSRSLFKKEIIQSSYSVQEPSQRMLRGLYLYSKLNKFVLSDDFVEYINEHVHEVNLVFYEYCSTKDLILKNELEKYIIGAVKNKPKEIKYIWNKYGLLKQLDIFLLGAKTNQGTYFSDRLDQVHRYAKMIRE